MLFQRYAQVVSDAARRDREPAPYDMWAREATWLDFVRLARLVLVLPPFVWADWATANPVPSGGCGFHSTVIARRLIDALVMVRQLLKDMKAKDRAMARATREYLKEQRRSPLLGEARVFVLDWFLRAASIDRSGYSDNMDMVKDCP